jgi:hypothetical protein
LLCILRLCKGFCGKKGGRNEENIFIPCQEGSAVEFTALFNMFCVENDCFNNIIQRIAEFIQMNGVRKYSIDLGVSGLKLFKIYLFFLIIFPFYYLFEIFSFRLH